MEENQSPAAIVDDGDKVSNDDSVPARMEQTTNCAADIHIGPKKVEERVFIYNPRKPKWWNRLGNNGRDATKSQKKAIRRVLDGVNPSDTQDTPRGGGTNGIRLPSIPYGSTLNWKDTFSCSNTRDIWLELGFGRGENLQALLEKKFETCQSFSRTTTLDRPKAILKEEYPFYLVGAEVSGVGIGCLCKRIDQRLHATDQILASANSCRQDKDYVLYRPSLDPYSDCRSIPSNDTNYNLSTTDDSTKELANFYKERLRIHAGDGYKLLPKLPDNSLAVILITFPDPFPKESDIHYRLIQHQTLLECHRLLRKTDRPGRLFLATDHDGYHQWCHEQMDALNASGPRFKPLVPCPDRMEWLPAISRYEQKGWDEGRSTKLTCWEAI